MWFVKNKSVNADPLPTPSRFPPSFLFREKFATFATVKMRSCIYARKADG